MPASTPAGICFRVDPPLRGRRRPALRRLDRPGGRAGEMDYLKRRDDNGTLLRSTVQTAIPWARSVIVCALNYNAAAPLSTDPAPPNTGWIARYAPGAVSKSHQPRRPHSHRLPQPTPHPPAHHRNHKLADASPPETLRKC